MPKLIDFPQLEACLYLRIPPVDFMAHDCTPLVAENTQKNVINVLRDIMKTNCYYVKMFLAQYMRLLEAQNAAVIDDLYELYVEPGILNARELPATEADILRYLIDKNGNYVSIKETPRVISAAGTTGLRTWEAALFLCNYFANSLKFAGFFANKSVLELGSGTGLVSLALLKNHGCHQFREITLTDGDSALLEKIPETLKMNSLNDPTVAVKVQRLIWGETLETSDDFCAHGHPDADIVVAADVTYDALVVPQLCHEISRFFSRGATAAFVAATVRNVETIEAWENELLSRFLWSVCERLEDPHTSGLKCWFRRGTPKIRVYEIVGMKGA